MPGPGLSTCGTGWMRSVIADLIILGLAIKIIVGAVQRGRQREPDNRSARATR